MSIDVNILGHPGADNATYIEVDTGSAIHRLLFDCGERCLDSLSAATIHEIDHLFFSHFHMDHICGFDSFFRLNYNRPERPVYIWGPVGTIDVIANRLRGVTWNLHRNQPGIWILNEISESKVKTVGLKTKEAFRRFYFRNQREYDSVLIAEDDYTVSARLLSHGSIPSVGYRIDEPERENIDPSKLQDLGLKPGPWIKEVKDSNQSEVEVAGETLDVDELRKKLLVTKAGESAAYLTDFILAKGDPDWAEVVEWLSGVDTLVCEAQFTAADQARAEKNSHMTTRLVAELAAESKVGKLLLQHVSRRYDSATWLEMLNEAKSIFPASSFPKKWAKYLSRKHAKE